MSDLSVAEHSARHVKDVEAARLNIKAGWYGHKVSGTFITGPHDSEAECNKEIKVLFPPPVPASKRKV